jgi:hypothetical protein
MYCGCEYWIYDWEGGAWLMYWRAECGGGCESGQA